MTFHTIHAALGYGMCLLGGGLQHRAKYTQTRRSDRGSDHKNAPGKKPQNHCRALVEHLLPARNARCDDTKENTRRARARPTPVQNKLNCIRIILLSPLAWKNIDKQLIAREPSDKRRTFSRRSDPDGASVRAVGTRYGPRIAVSSTRQRASAQRPLSFGNNSHIVAMALNCFCGHLHA